MTTDEKQLDDLPEPRRTRRRGWLPNVVWLIPIVAALVGISMVVKIVMERGPVITITFRSAEGLEAGKTTVRYKEVEIGTVQTIGLAGDRSHVLVKVQLSKEAESFTVADTRFWVVRPRLAAGGVSGLGTLFSGAYIGVDGGVSKETAEAFTGLEAPPVVTRDSSGRQFVLRAPDLGSLDIGSPLYFRRIKVGQVVAYDLAPGGNNVGLRIFVNAPYDQYVGVDTRFWHASGVSVHVDASGLTLNTQSLATVLLGGVAFQTPEHDEAQQTKSRAPENTEFLLADSRESAFKDPPRDVLDLVMPMRQSIRGLSTGAPVEFRGVVIGEVKSIGVEYDSVAHEFRMPVGIQIYPERLGKKFSLSDGADRRATQLQRLQRMVQRGMRAQLRSANLLTGQLYVALDFFPKAAPAQLDVSQSPIMLPIEPNTLDQIQAQLGEISTKLSKVPFDKIADDLQRTLKTMNGTLASAEQLVRKVNSDVAPEITAALADVRKTMRAAEHTLSDEAPLQQDLRQTLQELRRAAGSIRVLTDTLEQHPEILIRGKQEEK